ncbi:hypothetical protein ElyMa_005353600 [Elysia marginata]|uniref:Uncharacterized protein n=1 Tax=Elysia marginata TaxID=1093978 RepID=A0AAV4ECC6_9GAST|nr:hypothetical protein ElyMa_005353600 [Elysia marginata]
MSEEISSVLKSTQETLIKLDTRISVLETDKESGSRPVQQKNKGSFSEASLQNVRVAAELAAAQSRFSQGHSPSRGSHARGRYRGGGNYSFWSRPFHHDGHNDNTHRGHHGGGFPPTHRSTDEA